MQFVNVRAQALWQAGKYFHCNIIFFFLVETTLPCKTSSHHGFVGLAGTWTEIFNEYWVAAMGEIKNVNIYAGKPMVFN
jgi:hypothetical protein